MPKNELKKVDVPDDPNPNSNPKSIEELEKEIAETTKELASYSPTKKMPPKPARRKVVKRYLEDIDGHIEMSKWVPVVRNCFPKDSPYEFSSPDEGYRFDVSYEEWRMVVMACYGAEFTVQLYYDYPLGMNTKQINVNYIKLYDLSTAVTWAMDSMELFRHTEEERKNAQGR